MVSAIDTDKQHSTMKTLMYHHDPDGTGAQVTTPDGGTTEQWEDMRDFGSFAVRGMSSNLTGAGITKIEIVANTASDGSGTTVVIKDSGVVAADALGDHVGLECTAEEVRQEGVTAGVDLRYVAARLTVANAADEAAVLHQLAMPRFAQKDLTADVIA